MALTPEQVLNRHFATTQFRRGYEERDVDDFLDEIVAEMRSLIEQRDDFQKQLNECRAGKNQPAVKAAVVAPAPVVKAEAPAVELKSGEDDAKVHELAAQVKQSEQESAAAQERAANAQRAADEAEAAAKERTDKAMIDET